MSLVKSFTTDGVLDGKQNVVFGISASTLPDPTNPPSGPLMVTVRDDSAFGGNGIILARIVIGGAEGGMQSVIFPAGVRCTNGVAITITQPTPNPHTDVHITIDYS